MDSFLMSYLGNYPQTHPNQCEETIPSINLLVETAGCGFNILGYPASFHQQSPPQPFTSLFLKNYLWGESPKTTLKVHILQKFHEVIHVKIHHQNFPLIKKKQPCHPPHLRRNISPRTQRLSESRTGRNLGGSGEVKGEILKIHLKKQLLRKLKKQKGKCNFQKIACKKWSQWNFYLIWMETSNYSFRFQAFHLYKISVFSASQAFFPPGRCSWSCRPLKDSA